VLATESLANTLLATADRGKDIVIPGYTHLQAAMPSSFGLLFGGYAESLADDLRVVRSAWEVSNRNPLGSAAGYGSSFPLNRMRTTELLGFSGLNVSSVYAQMTRGKAERIALQAVASVAQTVGRMAMDVCLYTSQNFAFLSLPASFTTGSSIMPHKKNPDVFELIRAHCNRLQSYPAELSMMMANLPSGYHRDLQLVKEIVMPAFQTILTVLSLAEYAMGAISMNVGAMDDSRYDMVYSVENVNALVRSGMPFRDAYKAVAAEIESGTFSPVRHLEHSHLGSIGNPGLQEIRADLQATVATFNFTAVRTALQNLRTFVPL
jgi:argininosuccinate lyase